MKSRCRILFLCCGLAALILLDAGCAKYPDVPVDTVSRRLYVQVTVAGKIDPTLHYYVAFDLNGNPDDGPIPIGDRPWANGWGTGEISHYVLIDVFEPSGYGVYRIEPGTDLLDSTYLGQPLSFTPLGGGPSLSFVLDMDVIDPAGTAETAEFNIIATDVVPQDPNFEGPREYDALGLVGNTYVTIPLDQNRIFTNATLGGIEGQGDVDNADLDIVDWRIEVTLD